MHSRINQVEVLEKEGSLWSSSLSGVGLLERVTLRVGLRETKNQSQFDCAEIAKETHECGAIRLLHNLFGRHSEETVKEGSAE